MEISRLDILFLQVEHRCTYVVDEQEPQADHTVDDELSSENPFPAIDRVHLRGRS